MELYNFFTEFVEDEEDIKWLKECYEELKPICVSVSLCLNEYSNGIKLGKKTYSIIGQKWGDDTNIGCTELLVILSGLKYYWFDAYCPTINNLKVNYYFN